jgi:hypothetical protein
MIGVLIFISVLGGVGLSAYRFYSRKQDEKKYNLPFYVDRGNTDNGKDGVPNSNSSFDKASHLSKELFSGITDSTDDGYIDLF